MEFLFSIEKCGELRDTDYGKEIILFINVTNDFYTEKKLSIEENPDDAFSIFVTQYNDSNEVDVEWHNEYTPINAILTDKEKELIMNYVKEHDLHTKIGIILPD